MKKKPASAQQVREMRPEYRFDYSESRPNRFAGGIKTGGALVVLDADVAEVFRTSDAVNNFLRSVIAALSGSRGPKRRSGRALQPAAPKRATKRRR